MRWTRLSFYYLIGYLTFGGLGLLASPKLALGLFGATGDYRPELARLSGALLLGLGILVTQIVRHRVEVLYPTTLVVRVVIVSVLVGLYLTSHDPLFLVLTGIVGLGMLLTGAGLLTDRWRP